ncbi:MAG: class I SAM-dependent methyltransferase, partial [OM182 bacterium]|nr:class I SAM-dependent methyltransferase [OM182 bacterium]
IAPLLEKLFGYHLLFIGACKDAGMIESSPITHKIVLGNRSDAGDVGNNVGLFSDPRALALQNESIDVVVLQHALEFTASSRAVLREAVRVLRPGGHIVLITFQPLSLWGLKRLLYSAIPLRGAESRQPPWEGRFRHPSRLIDWLGVLDVQELISFSAMHEFPLQFSETGVRLKRLAETMENWGLKFKSPFGASNIIVGIKQSRPLTPSALKWRRPLPTPIHGVPSTLQGHSSQSGVSWKACFDTDKINADRED